MAYDEDVAHRLRELLADEDDVTEKKMFGGLAFMVDGHLTIAASRTGGLLVRVAPDDTPKLLERDHVTPGMGGRVRAGWVSVGPEGARTKRQCASWVTRSLAYVRTLPAG